MHGNALTESDVISVGSSLPKIRHAEHMGSFLIRLTFDGGPTRTVDVRPTLESRALFAPLRDNPDLFRRFVINEDGNALEWPGEIELSAVWLARLDAI